jgi:anti-sigma factor RsiW
MNDSDIAKIAAAVATRYKAPAGLSRRVTAALREHDPSIAPDWIAQSGWRRWARLAGAFACGLVASWFLLPLMQMNEASNRLTADAVSNHVRSMMASHLMDVASSDQHTVKPWFNGKLMYSPPVRDLSAEQFPLAGGRLDYLDGRPVAALVYRHRLHVINLFVMPCQGVGPDAKTSSRDGFNVIRWCDDGMRYLAVSDLNAEELSRFAQLQGRKD